LRDFTFLLFLNLQHNFWFIAIWHGQSLAALIFCRRLAESDVTAMPSVMYWLCCWRYSQVALVVSSSTALTFLTNVSEKCKSASSAIQAKKSVKDNLY